MNSTKDAIFKSVGWWAVKNAKAPNVFERAKEEFEAVVHNGKHKHHQHHKETHGLRDGIDANTPTSDVKAPNVFERAKEEIEAIVEAIHPKKESKPHDSQLHGDTRLGKCMVLIEMILLMRMCGCDYQFLLKIGLFFPGIMLQRIV